MLLGMDDGRWCGVVAAAGALRVTPRFCTHACTHWQAYTASSGDAFCGSTSSGWNEAFISDHVTFAHADDKLVLQFTTNLNSAGTDEAWGLVGVAVYLS